MCPFTTLFSVWLDSLFCLAFVVSVMRLFSNFCPPYLFCLFSVCGVHGVVELGSWPQPPFSISQWRRLIIPLAVLSSVTIIALLPQSTVTEFWLEMGQNDGRSRQQSCNVEWSKVTRGERIARVGLRILCDPIGIHSGFYCCLYLPRPHTLKRRPRESSTPTFVPNSLSFSGFCVPL